MTRARVMIPFRLIVALIGLVAVGTQLGVTLVNDYSVVNFFSYYTNLSNLFAVVVFTVGAVRTARRRPGSRGWDVVRLVNVVNMVFVGLVFNLLLAGVGGGVIPWVNVVVHMLVPVAALIDWLVLPAGRRLPWAAALVGLVTPVIYSLYTIVRGAVIGFYPYPFYDPAAQGGGDGVAVYVGALLVALTVLSFALVGLGRAAGRLWRARRAS
jgi:hypothetical protein